MNIIRYLSFEINRDCNNSIIHKGKCPISHPERYKYSSSSLVLKDSDILGFWRRSRKIGFRGIVLWHMYNEPVIELSRVRYLMKTMKMEDSNQPFQLTTSIPGEYPDFDIVKISDYEGGLQLDNRIETIEGEGKPYQDMPKRGWCGRGKGWEIPIDNFGNWCLCCGDWRCEESVGSICNMDWDILYKRWNEKRKRIQWNDEKTYNALPRMCRSCLDKNPSLSRTGGI